MNALYTFNWKEGGFNQVWARTKREALTVIRYHFRNSLCKLTPDLKSFKRLTKKADQDAYWKSLPLMD